MKVDFYPALSEGAYYHIYNRGVDKADIFRENRDYKTFLSFLKLYLTAEGMTLKASHYGPVWEGSR